MASGSIWRSGRTRCLRCRRRSSSGTCLLQVAEPVGAQAQQAVGLGVEGVADEIEVHAVLDGLRLRHLGERDTRPAGVPSPASRTACSAVELSATCRPRTSAQNRATVAASEQSKVTSNSELLTVGIPFARRRLCERTARSDVDRVAAHVPEEMAAGDPAPFLPGRRDQMAVWPPSAAMTAPVM